MRKMINLKKIFVTAILCGFISVVGLSFDVYAGSNGEEQEEQSTQNTEVSTDVPAQDYSKCIYKALEMYVSVEDTTQSSIIKEINSHFGEANWSVTDDEIITEARRLAEKIYGLELKAEYKLPANHIEKEVVEAANGEEWQDCKERVANGEDIECKQGEMTEDVPNEGHGYSDLYNGGNT